MKGKGGGGWWKGERGEGGSDHQWGKREGKVQEIREGGGAKEDEDEGEEGRRKESEGK